MALDPPPTPIDPLKREWTGRRVTVVDEPALRRFAGRTGTVVTVNMNGRALVQFDGAVQRGRFDLPLDGLRVVEELSNQQENAETGVPTPSPAPTAKPQAKAADVPKTAAPAPGVAAILAAARRQGAAKP